MRRREFAKLVAATVAWPITASAQKPMPVIGFLSGAPPDSEPRISRVPPGIERDRLRRGTKLGDRIPLGGGPL